MTMADDSSRRKPAPKTRKRRAAPERGNGLVNVSPRAAVFAREYVASGMDAKAAAMAVGVEEERAAAAGSQMLNTVGVRAELEAIYAPALRKAQMTAEDIISEYEAIAQGDITDVISWANEITYEEDGQTVVIKGAVFTVPSHKLPKHVRRAIQEVRSTANGIVVKMHDKSGALAKLESIIQMPSAVQRHVHTGEGGGPIETRVTSIRRIVVYPDNDGEPGHGGGS